jgi:DNA polymerase delta subunit 2
MEVEGPLFGALQKKWNHSEFLSEPPIVDAFAYEAREENKIIRESTAVNFGETRFLSNTDDHADQYFKLYTNRLQELKPAVLEKAKQEWIETESTPNKPRLAEQILDVRVGEECIIIGTLFKDMPLKPNVLQEYSKQRALAPLPQKDSFVSEKDVAWLEDDSGRIKLAGVNLDLGGNTVTPASLLTGQVVAIRGCENEQGDFEVHGIVLPNFAQQTNIPIEPKEAPVYVALVSGMKTGSTKANPLYLHLLTDFLTGDLGSSDEQKQLSRIARVIVAGNTVCSEDDLQLGAKLKDQTNKFTKKEQSQLSEAVKEADNILASIARSVPTDVMPGPNDPSNYHLPQQPLNKCLLPRSSKLKALNRTTNPYSATIEGVSFLGHSGQPLESMNRYINAKDKLELLEKTLLWRHMVPTAPDSIACMAFAATDPFVITESPHIYFSGNADSYQTKQVAGPKGQIVRLIMVPSFADTRTIVLVNLKTLSCEPVTFSDYMEE